MPAGRHVVIIGGGPGGYVAAIRCAQRGARVTLVEEEEVGGTCLNKGCIPSKALIYNAESLGLLQRAEELGVRLTREPGFDIARMLERKQRIVNTQIRGIHALLKGWGVALIKGRGRLLGPRSVEAADPGGGTRRLEADRVILATGSKPIRPSAFPFDGQRVMTSEQALEPRVIPPRLLIIGAGVEGCEFAFLYRALGSSVSMVDIKPRVLPTEDDEISAVIQREMNKRNIETHLGVTVDKIQPEPAEISVILGDGRVLRTDQVLVSVGRRMNSEGIGLESAGVERGARGEIPVDESLQTRSEGIFAIGDVLGRIMLAHVASAEGKVAAANAAGDAERRAVMDYRVTPAGIFTHPEIGTVGLKEWEARDQGIKVRVGRHWFRALGRAHTMDETAGLVKIIADEKTDRILGVHIVGPHASDIIHEAAAAMRFNARSADLAELIHAHPTFPEAIQEAAEDVHGSAIHQAPRPAAS